MIRVVMFDLDGTLVDTSDDLTEALNYAILPYDLPRMTSAKTKAMVGEGVKRLVEKVLGEEHISLKEPVLDRFLTYYTGHLSDFSVCYPGVVDTLKRLRNVKKTVVSNKLESLSKRLLSDLNIASYFDIILGSDSVGEEKPSPKPLLHVMNLLKCRPSEAVIVGDSSFDLMAGKAAGVRSVAVTYGFRDKEQLRDADFIIDSITKLAGLLEEINSREPGVD